MLTSEGVGVFEGDLPYHRFSHSFELFDYFICFFLTDILKIVDIAAINVTPLILNLLVIFGIDFFEDLSGGGTSAGQVEVENEES